MFNPIFRVRWTVQPSKKDKKKEDRMNVHGEVGRDEFKFYGSRNLRLPNRNRTTIKNTISGGSCQACASFVIAKRRNGKYKLRCKSAGQAAKRLERPRVREEHADRRPWQGLVDLARAESTSLDRLRFGTS